MVDKTLILRKLAELDQYLIQIKEFSHISTSDYASDWKTQRIVDRTLQIMIETCLDIAAHIISDEGFRVPQSYADMFQVLNENAIVPTGTVANLRKMAKFRNLVVHHYEKMDPTIIVSILQKNLTDIDSFKNQIIRYLNKIA